MKKLFFFLCICSLAVFSGCQKELDEEHLVLRGDWDSDRYALQIYQNGYGVCNSNRWGSSLTCEGRVKVKGRKLIFTSTKEESTLGRKKFDIDQWPTTDQNGITYMILDGRRFERR